MAIAYVLTIAHPSGTPSKAFNVLDVEIGGTFNEAATFICTLAEDCEKYVDDGSALNPVQTNAYITITRDGAYILRGVVETVEIAYQRNGQIVIRISGSDNLARLNYLAAGSGTTYVGKVYSSPTQYNGAAVDTRTTLLPLNSASTTHGSSAANLRFYSEINTYAWRTLSGATRAPYSTLGADLTDSATLATGAHSADEGFKPMGIIRVDDGSGREYIAYNGHDLSSDYSAYEWHNLLRGCLGTSGTAFLTNDAVDMMIPFRISDSRVPVLYGWRSGDLYADAAIDPQNYTIQYDEGCFDFAVNPLSASLDPPLTWGGVAKSPDEIRATYSVVAEDGNAYQLGGNDTYGIFEKLLAQTVANGGPGLTNANWTASLRRIVLPYLYLSSVQSIRDVLDHLIDDLGPQTLGTIGGTTHYAVCYWYDSVNADFVLKAITQSASSAATYIKGVVDYKYDTTLADAVSALLVQYRDYGDPDSTLRTLLVKLAGTYAAGSDEKVIFREPIYNKLVSGGFGVHRVGFYDAGYVQRGSALALARAELLRRLQVARTRVYTVRGELTAIPDLGDTVIFPDGFYGVLTSWHVKVVGGSETFTFRVCDFTGNLT